jgi:serine/threonine-protein kinase
VDVDEDSVMVARVSGCLSNEAIVAHLSGGLAQDAGAAFEAHIVCCDACRGMVADAAFGALVNTGESAVDPPPATGVDIDDRGVPGASVCPRPGEVIAEKYLVEDYLGSGSMGWVVAARHRDLGLRVAIKVLRSAGPEAARRFLAEAQICARLSHTHIPRVFDIGRLPGGAPYIVMEYLVGHDLAEVGAAGPVPIRDAVRWVMQACGALSEAHAAGIIHRDLKPANLFLATGPGGEAVVKVLDFGISKVATPGLAGAADGATATGTSAGSPLYMSPEQIRAQRTLDARSDIWSLGVILYQLITGRAPFRGPGLPALAVAIAIDAPLRPSSLRPDLSSKLERIILRCLAKSPAERYARVTELVAALASLDEQAIETRGARPRRWALALGFATALAGGVATVVLRRPSSATATTRMRSTALASERSVKGEGALPVASPVSVSRPVESVSQPSPASPAFTQAPPGSQLAPGAVVGSTAPSPSPRRREGKRDHLRERPVTRSGTTPGASSERLRTPDTVLPTVTNGVGPLDTPD